MARLPSKKVIWLVVVLVVITIGLLWYVGYKNKQAQSSKEEKILQELLTKQENLESAVGSGGQEVDNSDLVKLNTNQDWTKVEIKLASTSDTETITTYGQNLTQALKAFALPRENEVQIVVTALDKKDPNEVKKLVASRINYENAIIALQKINVPPDLASLHKQLIGNMTNIATLLSQMENVLTNPATAMQASRLFLKESLNFYQIFTKINAYFASRQINLPDDQKLKLFINFN